MIDDACFDSNNRNVSIFVSMEEQNVSKNVNKNFYCREFNILSRWLWSGYKNSVNETYFYVNVCMLWIVIKYGMFNQIENNLSGGS